MSNSADGLSPGRDQHLAEAMRLRLSVAVSLEDDDGHVDEHQHGHPCCTPPCLLCIHRIFVVQRDVIRAPLRPAAATCRSVQGDCRQLLDRDRLVFDRFIKRLRIAGLKAAHTLRVCGIELALGGANRLSAGSRVHPCSRIAWGAKVFLCSPLGGVRLGLGFLVIRNHFDGWSRSTACTDD